MLLWCFSVVSLALSSLLLCLLLRSYYSSKPPGVQSLLDPIKADLILSHAASVNVYCSLLLAKAVSPDGHLPRPAVLAGQTVVGTTFYTTVMLVISHALCWHLAVFWPGVMNAIGDRGAAIIAGIRVSSLVLSAVIMLHGTAMTSRLFKSPFEVPNSVIIFYERIA